MADDVIQKIIAANNQHEGSIVMNALPNGQYTVLTSGNITQNFLPVSGVEAKYTNRFDNINYYT